MSLDQELTTMIVFALFSQINRSCRDLPRRLDLFLLRFDPVVDELVRLLRELFGKRLLATSESVFASDGSHDIRSFLKL